jgi:hypothetical protein
MDVRSDFVHNQGWVESAKLLLDIVHGATDETSIAYEG